MPRTKKARPGTLCNMFIRGVPLNLKNAFKATCTLRQVNMRDILCFFMRKFCRDRNREAE